MRRDHLRVTLRSTADAQHDAVFRAVGFLVITWGLAERNLDFAAERLYRRFRKQLNKGRLPKHLEPKLEFVQQCIESFSELSDLQDEARRLVQDYRDLSVIRHGVIHGAMFKVFGAEDRVTFSKLEYQDDRFSAHAITLNTKGFKALSKRLLALVQASARFADALIRRDWPQDD